jgi:hypothetical protein
MNKGVKIFVCIFFSVIILITTGILMLICSKISRIKILGIKIIACGSILLLVDILFLLFFLLYKSQKKDNNIELNNIDSTAMLKNQLLYL